MYPIINSVITLSPRVMFVMAETTPIGTVQKIAMPIAIIKAHHVNLVS